MEYTIVDKPAFEIMGKSKRISTKDGENMRLIPAFWQEAMGAGLMPRLMSNAKLDGVVGERTLGVCADFAPDMSEFTYIIGVEQGNGDVPDDLITLPVPALTWAVVTSTGAMPDAIQNVWGYIMGEFFETSGYAHGPGPDLEVYGDGDPFSPDYEFEVWVPVLKK